jgi:hypothetical protein
MIVSSSAIVISIVSGTYPRKRKEILDVPGARLRVYSQSILVTVPWVVPTIIIPAPGSVSPEIPSVTTPFRVWP